MMVSLHSSEVFRLLLLPQIPWKQQTHQEVGCVRQRDRERVISVVRVFSARIDCVSVAMPLLRGSPCPCSRRRRHLQWLTLLRLFQKAEVVLFRQRPHVFTFAFASVSVVDLFSVIDGRNCALGCVCDFSLLNLEFAVFVVQSCDSLHQG